MGLGNPVLVAPEREFENQGRKLKTKLLAEATGPMYSPDHRDHAEYLARFPAFILSG